MNEWTLLGAFPDSLPDDVGSWLLTHNGESLLLEIPPGLTISLIKKKLTLLRAQLKYVTASHSHEDHFDDSVWSKLQDAFPETHFLHTANVDGYMPLDIGGEPCWLIKAPKHSTDDVICVFRGQAMTGDIELGTLDAVNDEVGHKTKKRSMRFALNFCKTYGYHVHTTFSAHLNDRRENVVWQELFRV